MNMKTILGLWFIVVLTLGSVGIISSFARVIESPPIPDDPWAVVITERDLSAERDSIVRMAAREFGVPDSLAVAVSHVENWSGDSMAISTAGAIGLMQVIPRYWLHAKRLICAPTESFFTRSCNARVGAFVLLHYHGVHGNWPTALRAYNGALRYRRAGDRYVGAVERAYGGALP